MAKRLNWRLVKLHRNYTVQEAAKLLGVDKGTVLRWVVGGSLPALKDRRPYLILGRELREFLKGRKQERRTCGPAQCYCFACRTPRDAAGRMADIWPVTPKIGSLVAICDTCGGLMQRRIALSQLATICALLDVTIRQAPRRIEKCDDPSLNVV